jgi:hypothetical protein
LIILIVLVAVAIVLTVVPALKGTTADTRSLEAFSRTCSALSQSSENRPSAPVRVEPICPQGYYSSRSARSGRPRLSPPSPLSSEVIVVGRRPRPDLTVVGTPSRYPKGRDTEGETPSAGRAEAGRV